MPILGDLYAVLKESSSTLRLANILNRLVSGSAKTFNQQTNVSLDNKYIVLDISELTGDLADGGNVRAPMISVWDKAKENHGGKRPSSSTNAGSSSAPAQQPAGRRIRSGASRRSRGLWRQPCLRTQDLNDFFALDDGKYGKGIINNSKTKILLNLEEEEAQRVQGVPHLSKLS